MRCNLLLVSQSTEELSIHTNDMKSKASLMNGDHVPMVHCTIGEGVLMIGICLCILDMHGKEHPIYELKKIIFNFKLKS